MAKGLGAIMAELALSAKVNSEAPTCPLCGKPMTNNGAGWFCYSGPDRKCPRMHDLEEAMYAFAPRSYIENGMAVDSFQGQTFAAIVAGSRLLAEFGSVRGGGGRTNLRIWCGEGVRHEDIPALIQEHGWTWWEWVPDSLKAEV